MNSLWYRFPVGSFPNTKWERASCWEKEALPIGNSYMGAMIYGTIKSERIQFNEKTLWKGGPNSKEGFGSEHKTDAASHLAEIRQTLMNGEKEKALDKCEEYLVGSESGFGAFQNFGEIKIDFNDVNHLKCDCDIPKDYRRELNLDKAIEKVSYTLNDVLYERTAFCSYPDNVMVYTITSDKSGAINADITFVAGQDNAKIVSNSDNIITLSGAVPDNGLLYEAQLKVILTTGTATQNNGIVTVKDCSELMLILSCGTNYKNEYPSYRGENPHEQVAKRIKAATLFTYDELLNHHLCDYQPLFNRVNLHLADINENIPTDEMLSNYPQDGTLGLEALMFKFGRYLLISSSRKGTLPANLQGVWCQSNNPDWCSDYHFNINLQMNYWPSESANLTECSDSLVDYVESLKIPGEITAREFFGAKSGWTVNTMNNPFGYTSPGWNFRWGWAPNSSAFICQNLWEKYAFSQDITVLKRIYPILKGAALCWSDFLSEDKDGTLVSSPSFSPEHGDCEIGCAMDQQLVQDLFTNTINASKLLGCDESFRFTLENQLSRLSNPHKIGRFGQLQEWKDDLDDPDEHHRHISQLVSLFPCPQITRKTPELMEAAKVTLRHRGDEQTGWSRAWKLCMWARTGDGNYAHKILQGQLMNCTYGNLFDFHPPFQIDGNFGYTTGVCEMLMQSHLDEIDLLPALPDCWGHGEFVGLCARGGFLVSCKWENSTVKEAVITSKQGNKCTISLPKNLTDLRVTDNDGNEVCLSRMENCFIFDTKIGGVYNLTAK